MVSDTGEQSDPKLRIGTKSGYSLRRTSARVKAIDAKNSTAAHKKKGMKKWKTVNKTQRNEKVTDEVVGAPVTDNAAGEKSAYARVAETLRAFNKHYLRCIQAEEVRCGKNEANKKENRETGSEPKKAHNRKARPDLKAIKELRKAEGILYSEKRPGSIPGIDVGHQFFARCEMLALGFHQQSQGGIDYIAKTSKISRKALELSKIKLPIAVSIILSGQYEDDLDNSEEIVYTGQGGNNHLGDKSQVRDQVLKRGNLALKNSMEQSVPVRVVRGHNNDRASCVGKIYTYDGLYQVVECWAEKGVSGFTVYKFRLKRLEGQPPLTTKEVFFTRARVPKSTPQKRLKIGFVCDDISGGLEKIPIRVINLIDDTPISTSGFTYIKNMKFSENVSVPTIASAGCKCQGTCTDPRTCACAKLNGGGFPCVPKNGGRLVEPKAIVFECGPNCGCGATCVNRTFQNGIKFRLEVFRTQNMGWGVRSLDHIPSGAPVCEYIGQLKRTSDLSPDVDTSYVMDIDCLQTMKGLNGRESRLGDVALPSYMQKVDEEISDSVPFCIDAGNTGNVARFINHSCQPNLFVQCMLSGYLDLKLARPMLVAAENIPPQKGTHLRLWLRT